MKKKAVIFPYNVQSGFIAKHREMLKEYEITALITLSGFALNGKDAGFAYNGENVGLKVFSSFDDIEKSYDTIIISETEFDIDFMEFVYPEIVKAIKNKKDIICLYNIEDNIRDNIIKLCKDNECDFKFFCENDNRRKIKLSELDNEIIMDINVPVVFVAGVNEKTNKFDIQLEMRKYFEDKGYRVSQIGTKRYCELFGFHSFPEFMFDDIAEWKKIVYFNRICKSIELSEEPDIFIIGIPGGIMPYNNTFTNKFGITAFEVSNAIIPDAVIMSILYEDFDDMYLTRICEAVKGRLGFNIDCFNISNSEYESNNSRQYGVMEFLTVSMKLVNNKRNMMKNYELPVFNTMEKNDAVLMSKCIENKLSGYSDSELF